MTGAFSNSFFSNLVFVPISLLLRWVFVQAFFCLFHAGFSPTAFVVPGGVCFQLLLVPFLFFFCRELFFALGVFCVVQLCFLFQAFLFTTVLLLSGFSSLARLCYQCVSFKVFEHLLKTIKQTIEISLEQLGKSLNTHLQKLEYWKWKTVDVLFSKDG